MQSTVVQLLKRKGSSDVAKIEAAATVLEALGVMAEKKIGALLVGHEEEILGIVSERDCARAIGLKECDPSSTRVEQVMTHRILYVRPDETAEQCLAIMSEYRIRHLPVMDEGKLVGMLSTGDVIKSLLRDKQFVIEQLTHYIAFS